MSNRDTDEQLSLNSSPSLFPLNRRAAASSGFSLAGMMGGRSTQLQADPEQAFRTTPTYLGGNSPLTAGSEAIEFRVTRDGSPSRRLRLSGRRYTFGSGEGCSIRLADVSLRPMHAVLIRDAHRVLVRAYSVPILVNGNRTTEAALSVGDRLQLGAYCLEMLGSDLDSRPSHAVSNDDIDRDWEENAFKLRFADGPKISSSRSALSKLGRESIDRPASLAAEESVWREQLRREVEQWRMAKAECERRESRCDDRETNMRERESELWNRSEHLRRRESELKAQEAAVLEIQQEYEAKKQSLARLQAEDRNRRDEFQRREAEFLKLEQEYRDQIEEVTRQLQRSQDQASVANETVQRIRDQFASLNGQLAELTAKQSALREQDEKKSADFRRTRQELEHARDVAIAERDKALADHDELASQSSELVSQRVSIVAELEARIARFEQARDSAIAERNIAISERDELVSQGGELVAQRDLAVAEKEAAVANREQAIRDRDDAETQCVQAIRNRDEAISQRNIALRERDEVIDARAQSDALRIQLIKDFAQAAERLGEVETELAESRRLIEQSEQSTDTWQQQVLQLQESVAAAKNETRLLRSEYEAACESIVRLEGMVKEQTQHANESKDSWMLEAEHLRQSFEGVSRDLAVALGELSHLRDSNTEFASQLESVKAEKARIESELVSRPTQDAWNAMEGELERASESLQIIQRDYDATLTELNQLRFELQDERQWAAQKTENQRAENPIAEISTTVSEPETPSAADPQWSDEENDAWPTYSATPLSPLAAVDLVNEFAMPSDHHEDVKPKPQESGPVESNAWRANSDPTDSIAEPSDVAVEKGRSQQSVDKLNGDVTEDECDSMSSSNSAALGWSTPLYPMDSPESEVHDVIKEESQTLDVEAPSESWHWPTAEADDEPIGSIVQQSAANGSFSTGVSVGEVLESVDSHHTRDVEDDGVGYGSLAQRLIADLHRDDPTPVGGAFANNAQEEDQENEAFFEATAVHAGVTGLAGLDDEAGQDELPASNLWNSDESSDEDEYHPTVVRSDFGLASEVPIVGGDEELEVESTSLWSRSQYDKDSYDDTSSVEQYNDASTFEQDSSGESNTYSTNDFGIAKEGVRSDSRVWTSNSDSVVMGSELVASDEDVSGMLPNVRREVDVVAPTPEPASQEFEDDSIEAYMNRLLQRAQGGSSSGSESSVSKTNSTALGTVAVQAETLRSTQVPIREVPADYDPDAPMMPRSQAPEKQGSLNAMRKLANESARTAINRSVKVQSRDTQLKAFAKFASAAGLVVCALAVFIFTHFPGTAIIACCMFVVAFVWVNEGLKLLRVARRRVQLAAAGKLEQEEADHFQDDARASAQAAEESKT